MEHLLQLLIRVMDSFIASEYKYFIATAIIIVFMLSPMPALIWKAIKFIINLGVHIPTVLSLVLGANLIYYGFIYKNPVGILLGIPFIILMGYLHKKYRKCKFIN